MQVFLNVYWKQYDWEDEGRIFVSSFGPNITADKSHMFLREMEVTIPDMEAPSRDQVARMKVVALESERQTILAETHQKVAKIDEQIRQLSAITYQEEPA